MDNKCPAINITSSSQLLIIKKRLVQSVDYFFVRVRIL